MGGPASFEALRPTEPPYVLPCKRYGLVPLQLRKIPKAKC